MIKKVDSIYKAGVAFILENKKFLFYFFILANILVRLYKLSDDSIYGDEAFSIMTALMPIKEMVNIFKFDQNPPLYFIVLHFWLKLFPVSAISAKLLSILMTVISSALIYKIAEKFGNWLTASLASLLFLFSNAILYYSHETRAFAMEGMLCLTSFYLFIISLSRQEVKYMPVLALVNLALLFTHYISVFIPFTQFVICLLYVKQKPRQLLYFSVSHTVAALIFLPWLFYVINNIPKESTYWLKKPDYDTIQYVFSFLYNNSIILYLHYLFVALTLVIIFIKNRQYYVFDNFNPAIATVFMLWSTLPFWGDFVLAQITPVFLLRYILYSYLGTILLISYTTSMLKFQAGIKIPVVLAIVSFTLFSFKINPKQENDWKTAVPKIKNMKQDKTAVLVSSGYKIKEFSFYYDLALFKDYANLAANLKKQHVFQNYPVASLEGIDTTKYDQLIFVKSHHGITDPGNLTDSVIPARGFEKQFEIADYSVSSDPVTIVLYTKSGTSFIQYSTTNYNNKNYDYGNKWKTSVFENKISQNKFTSYFTDFEYPLKYDTKSKLYEATAASGKYSSYANNNSNYSESLRLEYTDLLKVNKLLIKLKVLTTGPTTNAHLVTAIEKDKEMLLYNAHTINKLNLEFNKWHEVEYVVNLDSKISKDSFLQFYLFNLDSNSVFIDDLEIMISD